MPMECKGKKPMKKILACLAVLAVLCGVCACSQEKKDTPAPVPEPAKEAVNPYATQLKVMNKAKDLQKKSLEAEAARANEAGKLEQ